jgi:ribosome-associated protein
MVPRAPIREQGEENMIKNFKKPAVKVPFVLKDKGSIRALTPLHIAEELSYNWGDEVVVYDVRDKTPFVSYYIVASAKNAVRLNALVSEAKEALYENYQEVSHVEGKNDSRWILIDAGQIVVQLFTPEERKRVALDELYQNSPHKIVVQEEEPVYRKRKKPESQAQ